VVAPDPGPQPDGRAPDRPPLRLAGVSAAYGQLEVLAGLDLTLDPGTITALVGANGSGKTSLCKVVAGLLAATDGRVYLGGADVTAIPPHRRAGRLLLAPEARGIFPSLSVDDNLSVRLSRPGDPGRAGRARSCARSRMPARPSGCGWRRAAWSPPPLVTRVIVDVPGVEELRLMANLRDGSMTYETIAIDSPG
jgi:ABC-type Fe3+/spermidine/putrescine transport system ATPase subunit